MITTTTVKPNGAGPDLAAEERWEELARQAIALKAEIRGEPAPPPVFKSIPLAEFLARPPKNYLVNGLFGRGDVAVIFGAPKSGKTFVMIDLLFAMATGGKFAQAFDIPQPLTVCYCTNEGLSGLPNRFRSAAGWHNATTADYSRRELLAILSQAQAQQARGTRFLGAESAEIGRKF